MYIIVFNTVNGYDISLVQFSGENFSSSIFGHHKLYLGLYIVLAIFFTNYVPSYQLFGRLKWLYNAIFIGALLLLGTRTLLAISFAIVGVWPLLKWWREKKYGRIALLLCIVGIVVALNLKYNPILVDRFKESVNYNDQYNIKKQWGGTSVRKLIWEYSYKVLEDNPIFGVGIGDTHDELNKSYEKCTESSALKNQNYNTHNEVLQILVTTGLFGTALIFLAFLYLFWKSFKANNTLFIGFLLVFFVAGLTEAYLERDMGIRIFAFFSVLLFFTPELNENNPDT